MTDHLEINSAFKQYYSDLYTSKCDENFPQISNFFNNLAFPSIQSEHSSSLGGNISSAEILDAIKSLKSNKTAGRLEKVLPRIISTDQTGLILNRHSSSNLRRLLNIAYSPSASVPEMVISLDAEKAFDRVEWRYLFSVLKQFGFDNAFISWVQLLYAQPLAAVVTNGQQSEYFSLGRGTHQGCPLSPLLFAIAIEPLAIALRQSATSETTEEFSGIVRGGLTHKLSLYADDLLLYTSNPMTSVPYIVNILNQFGKLAYLVTKLISRKVRCFPSIRLQPKFPQLLFHSK